MMMTSDFKSVMLTLECLDLKFSIDFLVKIAWDVEVVVSDKEVWETFFDVAFDLVVHLSLDSSDISTVFENFGVK